MSISTLLARSLKIAHPIIRAPMAGGGDTPELVAAVSNAGGMGFIRAAYLTPEQIGITATAIRTRTSRPFGINLFAPLRPSSSQDGKAYEKDLGEQGIGLANQLSSSHIDNSWKQVE
jgi:nitronate monooxygenase